MGKSCGLCHRLKTCSPTTSSTDLPTTPTEPATTTAPCVDCRDSKPEKCLEFQRQKPQLFQMHCQNNGHVQWVCIKSCGLCHRLKTCSPTTSSTDLPTTPT